MRSIAPGSSGATVISRSPSTSGSSSRARHVGRHQQVGRVVGPAAGRREERSLEVEPERLGPVGRGVRQPGPDPLGEGGELRRAARSRRSAGTRSRPVAAAAGPSRRALPDRPSRRGRPSRGRGRRRTPGRRTVRPQAPRPRGRSTAIRPSSIVIRPFATRSSRTSRPLTMVVASVLKGRPRGSSRASRRPRRDPAPRRRTGHRARSGRPDSATRSPRYGARRRPR